MNEAKLNEFMGKVVTDMGGAWMMAMILIGDELGQGDGRREAGYRGGSRHAERLSFASGTRMARC
jgi:hypothetical protein